jgi:hypothetical protein
MDFTTTELGCALHKLGDVVAVQDVASHSQGAARLGGIDGVSDRVCFLYFKTLAMLPGYSYDFN